LAGGKISAGSRQKLAEHFITSPHQHATIFYGEVGTWYGALTFAKLTSDAGLRDRLIKRFDPLLPGGAETIWAGIRGAEREVRDADADPRDKSSVDRV
jgi:hypothetical protein